MPNDQNVNPEDYKGLLPVYMREGIPPYLQIIFSARPSLPYVKSKDYGRIPPLRGFSVDKDRLLKLKEIMDEKREERLLREEEEKMNRPQRHKLTVQEKEAIWFTKTGEHISKVKQEWKDWAANQKKSSEGKTANAYKTLIVYNLVR